MNFPKDLIGKTIASIESKYHYFGYIQQDCGDVSGHLLLITFTDKTSVVGRFMAMEGGDGSVSVSEDWFNSEEEAIDIKEVDDSEDEDLDEC